jgi:glutamate-1-semialdehyde 2,1-aminomutase
MAETADIVERAYRARTSRSAESFLQSACLLPEDVIHPNHYWPPYPPYVDHASGSLMFDVDGDEYIDYCVANGTMFMSYANPMVIAAVRDCLRRFTPLCRRGRERRTGKESEL